MPTPSRDRSKNQQLRSSSTSRLPPIEGAKESGEKKVGARPAMHISDADRLYRSLSVSQRASSPGGLDLTSQVHSYHRMPSVISAVVICGRSFLNLLCPRGGRIHVRRQSPDQRVSRPPTPARTPWAFIIQLVRTVWAGLVDHLVHSRGASLLAALTGSVGFKSLQPLWLIIDTEPVKRQRIPKHMRYIKHLYLGPLYSKSSEDSKRRSIDIDAISLPLTSVLVRCAPY